MEKVEDHHSPLPPFGRIDIGSLGGQRTERGQLLLRRGLGRREKVNFGTDPYLSHPLDALITSDACQMP
jgi:hypothetical protein